MSTPFIGEVRLFGFNFPPRNWARCEGQLLSIAQNQALFAILGTTYGGNGQNNFALPDLRGRTPLHFGHGIGLPAFTLGQSGGEARHTLTTTEMPAHTHAPRASSGEANLASPTNNLWGAAPQNPYNAATATVTLAPSAIGVSGASASHPNEQPYLVLNFSIALYGIFPSRS
ncbi:MAG TPA: tail fiber protein [Opitutaceae bacterium]|nr:tail fiber protein [Opitutaceae bacterium]